MHIIDNKLRDICSHLSWIYDSTCKFRRRLLLLFIPVLVSTTNLLLAVKDAMAESNVLTGTDEDAKLPFWEWQSKGMSIRLVQRLPDQSRGYFMARGFNKSQAERIAQSCIFQTVYKNTADAGSPVVIEYDLSKWTIRYNGKSRRLKLREAWEQEWQNESGVSKRAQIALQWSLLPTRQRYQAQDYNWGMTSFGIPPGTRFNLEIVWTQSGKEKTGQISNIECAADIHPEPKDPFS